MGTRRLQEADRHGMGGRRRRGKRPGPWEEMLVAPEGAY